VAEATGNSGEQGSGGGAGIYLIGLLVIAGAIVAIVLATRGGDKAAPTATVAQTEEPPAPKRINAPAPPAPPEDIDEEPTASAEPSASPSASSSAGRRTGSGGLAAAGDSGACAKCGKGKSSSALESKVRSVAGSAQGCYNRALRTSAASGTLVVAVSVGAGGASCGASIVSDSVGNSEISSCVLGRFQGQSWPAPEEGCVTVSVPINFKIAN
jgi:outer membrane biosynthesis protein TonB